jgi:acetyl esterase
MQRFLLFIAGLVGLFVLLIGIEFAMGPVTIADLRSAVLINYHGPRNPPAKVLAYKQTPTRPLRMHVFEAGSNHSGATVVLFHGGGFHSGWPDEFFPLATALAERGHTVFVPEYRLQRADGVAYLQELEDCRDALVWVAREAASYGGDPTKLVLGGSSAGAHLAAGLVTFPAERTLVSPPPLGLVLTAPYLDSSERSAKFESEPPAQGPLSRWLSPAPSDVFEGRSEEFSPRHHLHEQIPPVLVLAGEEDPLWPPGEEFCNAVRDRGVECRSRAFPGAGHAFSLKGQEHHAAAIEEIQEALERWLKDA